MTESQEIDFEVKVSYPNISLAKPKKAAWKEVGEFVLNCQNTQNWVDLDELTKFSPTLGVNGLQMNVHTEVHRRLIAIADQNNIAVASITDDHALWYEVL